MTGGAGRVGYYAIQFAKAAGATVIATAGNDEARRDCIAAGADFLVNHQNSDWGQQVLKISNGRKMDRVIEVDFGANLRKVLDIIRIGGVIATYSSTIPESALPFRRILFMDLTIRTVIVYSIPVEAKAAAIRDITSTLERGDLQHRIAATYPLEQFAESNKKIEKVGFYGCVIVTIE